jgi:hypothetical protein
MMESKRSHSMASGPGAKTATPETSPNSEGQERGVCTTEIGGVLVPESPASLDQAGVDPEVLLNLTLKLAYVSTHFSTGSTSRQLHLPFPLAAELLERLREEKMVEVLGEEGPLGYRFRITQPGRERAAWLMAISGYVGPAPVSLQAYSAMLALQLPHLPAVSAEAVTSAISDLVLSELSVEIAGLAASSGRSLFLYGPPGNGKTSLGRLIHRAFQGSFWIPHCIGVENHIIRVFDPQCHTEASADIPREASARSDQRWVRVRRPLVVVGGELTLADLDLIYDSARGYYEAPLHLKANGGTFLLDDFGSQSTPPNQLLNRWIVPLEHQFDYLTLGTGQQIQVPFRNLLVISTNLDPDKVMAPGLLRRMGYRLCVGDPSPQQYALIFSRYAAKCSLEVPPGLLDWLLGRYQAENRRLHGCEPRDLIDRARDICNYRGLPVVLTTEIVNLAWSGYFLNKALETSPPQL